MATSTVENPLAEGLAKVTGMDPMSSSAGTADLINYDPDLAFRQPEGDIISISGDPGSGATQAETWSHELSLENLRQDQLEFEYAMQQDLLDQAYQQQQYQLNVQSGQLAKQTQAAQESQWAQSYAIQQAEEKRAAALSPYQTESARLANEAASYANMEAKRKDDAAKQALAIQAGIQEQFRWQGNYPITPQSSEAYKNRYTPIGNPYQPSYAYKPGVSTYQPAFGTPDYKQYSQQPTGTTGIVW